MVLACGCEKGVTWCPNAKRLHDKMTALWRELQYLPPDDKCWWPYDEAREFFERHIGNEPLGYYR